ncbi:MAG: LamG-like jellyroll fold domain-containing protein, partial [Verrucomicrobiota bacterium]
PSSNLQPGDQYAVRVGTNAIEDLSGNLFVGINDDVTWNFSGDPNPNANLVAYWPLNDGTNGQSVTGADDVIDDPNHPATDAVASFGNGTWVNDATRGIVFSTGEDDRLSAGRQGISGDFTWSVWVRTSEIGGNNHIMGTRSGGPWNSLNPSSFRNWAGTLSFPHVGDDRWHHLAVRRSGSEVSVYRDGTNVVSGTRTGGFNGPLEIGGSSQFSEDLTGLVSDAAIWDEALSTNRIAALAAGGPVILSGLEIRKNVSAASLNLDQGMTNLIYTLEILNAFTADFGGVVVTDSLPVGVTVLTSAPPAVLTNFNDLVFDLGTLTAGNSATVTLEVAVTTTVAGELINFAQVTTTNTNVVATSDQDSARTLLFRPTDIAIAKDVSRFQSNFMYTITVSNISLTPATNVVVVDSLPAGAVFDTSMPPPDMSSGDDYTYNLGLVPPGLSTSIVLSMIYTSLSPAVITNVAAVTTDTAEDNLANNTASALASTANTNVELVLIKTVSPTNITVGGSNL